MSKEFLKIPIECINDVERFKNYYGKDFKKLPYLNFRDDDKPFCENVQDVVDTFAKETRSQSTNALFHLYASQIGFTNAQRNLCLAVERFGLSKEKYNEALGVYLKLLKK
jgi:hypothetical protein